MTVIVSACLLGENCKYSGGNNFSPALEKLLFGCRVIPVCPEVLGGLPVPRAPGEIKDGKVINKDGTSVDAEFKKGALAALEIALAEGAELAVLQSRSPSCGVGKIYDGTFSKTLIEGDGVFAALLKKNGIRAYDIKDIEAAGRLPE